MHYSLTDIKSIKKTNLPIKLNDSIIDIINNISKEVCSPDYNITPQFKYENKNWLKKNPRKPKMKNDFETLIDNIRTALNKITEQTYTQQLKLLEDNIKTFDDFDDLDKCNTINNLIYNIVTKNYFFSELYSIIYINLINKNVFIKDYFTIKKQVLLNEIDNVNNYMEHNDNYDDFCDLNKMNDARRSLILFHVNLMKKNCISFNVIAELRNKIQMLILQQILRDNKLFIVEELANLLFIIITNLDPDISLQDEEFMNYLENVLKFKSADYPSMSNKIKFKHMDIKDYLTKTKQNL